MKIYTFKDLKFKEINVEGFKEDFLHFDNGYSFSIHTDPYIHSYVVIILDLGSNKKCIMTKEYPITESGSKKNISALMREIQLLPNLK